MPGVGGPSTACLTVPVDPQPRTPYPYHPSFPSHQQRLQSQTASLELELQLCSSQGTIWGPLLPQFLPLYVPHAAGGRSRCGGVQQTPSSRPRGSRPPWRVLVTCHLYVSPTLAKRRVSEPPGMTPSISVLIGKDYLGTSVLSQGAYWRSGHHLGTWLAGGIDGR